MEELDIRRKQILKDILNYYSNGDKLQDIILALQSNSNIADILKMDAYSYTLLMNGCAMKGNVFAQANMYKEFEEELAYLNKGYRLYEDYVTYFLGGSIAFPSLEWQITNDNVWELSLLQDNGAVSYGNYIENLEIGLFDIKR